MQLSPGLRGKIYPLENHKEKNTKTDERSFSTPLKMNHSEFLDEKFRTNIFFGKDYTNVFITFQLLFGQKLLCSYTLFSLKIPATLAQLRGFARRML